jgi:methionyl-tRNA formyltransferase
VRIVIFTSEEPFYLPGTMYQIADAQRHDIAAIVITPPIHGRKTWWEIARLYRNLYGWWGFVVESWRFMSRKVLDRLSVIIPTRRFYSVRRVAQHFGIPIEMPKDINAPTFVARIRRLEPDLLVSMSSGQIFRRELLATAKDGCINVHSSLLPRYRGLLPTFWVLAKGEQETGVTVHLMDDHVDTGGILLQERVAIEPGETHDSLLEKTKRLGPQLLLEALDHFEKGPVIAEPNDSREGIYYSFPTAEEARRFRKAGLRFR